MQVEHDVGRTITIVSGSARAMLDYVSAPKPFLHPVTTPSGALMTLIEPHDHLWHRGLWFTFKFVDGDNFWEERDPFGRQQVVHIPTMTHPSLAATAIQVDLDWLPPGGAAPVIAERRVFTVALDDDATRIDLDTTLIAARDVTLDRTPYTTWGGYGGLAFRGSPSWHPDRWTLDGRITDGPLLGETSPWCDVSGPIDGGSDRTAGIAIFDHPANPRHPTPWYTGSGAGNFLNPSPLFHAALLLPAGQPLRLRYRVLVHDGRWDAAEVRRHFDRYVSAAGPD